MKFINNIESIKPINACAHNVFPGPFINNFFSSVNKTVIFHCDEQQESGNGDEYSLLKANKSEIMIVFLPANVRLSDHGWKKKSNSIRLSMTKLNFLKL